MSYADRINATYIIRKAYIRGSLKTAACILLTILMLTRLVGYKAVFYVAENISDKRLDHRLDSDNYEDSELLTIVVPLHNPYQMDQPEFQRTHGEIEVDGKIYRYVKRKIYNGELILKCIPHAEKMKIQESQVGYLAEVNDAKGDSQAENGKHVSTFSKLPFAEYDHPVKQSWFHLTLKINAAATFRYADRLTSPFISADGKPPRLV